MKKMITVVRVVLTVFLAVGTASASLKEESIDLQKELLKEQALQSFQEEYPDAQFINVDEAEGESAETMTPFQGAASPLTSLRVYAAISTKYPQYEYFALNQLTSTADHGGEEMYIVTREIGYSKLRIAQMGGEDIPMIMTEDIDFEW